MSEIGNLGKKGIPQLWIDTKQIDSRFITHLLSQNSNDEIRELTRVYNKFIYQIRESLLRKLIWLSLPEFDKNTVFKGYTKAIKKEEVSDIFKEKAKHYWKWSNREWEANKAIIFSDKEKLKYYADKFGLEDREKKKLGIIEKVKQKGLDRWS